MVSPRKLASLELCFLRAEGLYLRQDLDYSYSAAGDIPKHIPSLALPPSYYHRVISTGPLNVDPIVRIDVSPWGHEIARNLQLMQDKMVVETCVLLFYFVVVE